ncbi:MAG TPA: rhodanese-like domain-containing protein [Kofleriaceae bacterium]|jgi:rhodanese-related sulfurtransferase
MRTILFVSLVAISSITGCAKKAESKKDDSEMVQAKIPTVTVDQVDSMLAKGECTPVDANGDGTRKKMGVVPGAIMLTDSEAYAPSELPSDKGKALVFYCGNTQCGASHEAAAKALTAGYTNVKVMPDGIAGWVKAGKKVATI